MACTPENNDGVAGRRRRTPYGELSAAQVARIQASVLALEPMSDEQIAGVCEVIATARRRWRPGPAPGAGL